MSKTYTQEGYDKLFKEAIQHGYHECAKLIYPMISPAALEAPILGNLGHNLNEKIYDLYRSISILELLESYNLTLLFLLDINYKPKPSNTLLVFLPKLTQLEYNAWGKTPIFRELVTNLVKLGCDITDSIIVHSCMVRGAIGGLLILDEMNALTPELVHNNIKYLIITPESQSIINLASKYISIDSQQATFIISQYIQKNTYSYLHKNSSTVQMGFNIITSIIKLNNWIIILTDDLLNSIIHHPHLIPYVLDIITDIHITHTHVVTDLKTYEKLGSLASNIVFDQDDDMPELEWADDTGGDGW